MSSYKYITTNATTICSPTPVKLRKVVINTKGATSNIITLYDSIATAAGNILAIIDTTSVIGDIDYYGLNTTLGLVAVTSAGTAANITIVWD
jgi:hypothetical protein